VIFQTVQFFCILNPYRFWVRIFLIECFILPVFCAAEFEPEQNVPATDWAFSYSEVSVNGRGGHLQR